MHNLDTPTSVPADIIEKMIKDSINKPSSEVRDIINVFQNSATEYRPSHVQEKHLLFKKGKIEKTCRYAGATPVDTAAKISTTHHH